MVPGLLVSKAESPFTASPLVAGCLRDVLRDLRSIANPVFSPKAQPLVLSPMVAQNQESASKPVIELMVSLAFLATRTAERGFQASEHQNRRLRLEIQKLRSPFCYEDEDEADEQKQGADEYTHEDDKGEEGKPSKLHSDQDNVTREPEEEFDI